MTCGAPARSCHGIRFGHADKRFRPVETTAGQYTGLFLLFAVSFGASLLAIVVPRPYVGLLGLFPIVFGIKSFVDQSGSEEPDERPVKKNGQFRTVALITVANGGDNVAIYTPALAGRSAFEVSAFAAIFFIMTAAWCFAAYNLVQYPMLNALTRSYVRRFTPVLLIGLGAMILYQAGSISLLHAHNR